MNSFHHNDFKGTENVELSFSNITELFFLRYYIPNILIAVKPDNTLPRKTSTKERKKMKTS